MNNKQIAIVLKQLHDENIVDIEQFLNEKLEYFNLNSEEIKSFTKAIQNKYLNGIIHLNANQLANILSTNYDENSIKLKLGFYEIRENCIDNILNFFEWYANSNNAISVSQIDENFKGVQVASRDDFNMIINQGYTGDWVLTPSNIKSNHVQVASMNEMGDFPRGNYLNAEIDRIEPIQYGDQTRHRIFIKNHIIIDSGNRNVKFNLNPVRYIDNNSQL